MAEIIHIPATFRKPAPVFEALTEDQLSVLSAQDVLERLAAQLGSYARVSRILRSLAIIHGEAV